MDPVAMRHYRGKILSMPRCNTAIQEYKNATLKHWNTAIPIDHWSVITALWESLLCKIHENFPFGRIFGKISKLFEKFTDIVLSALFLEISFDATKGWIFGQKHLTLSIWQYSVKEVKLVNLSSVNLNIWRIVWTPEAFWVPTFSNISTNQHE